MWRCASWCISRCLRSFTAESKQNRKAPSFGAALLLVQEKIFYYNSKE
jgi:hypothetical protein